jgi:ribosomal protein S24E
MESKIVSQKNNPFLKREEVVIQIIDKTTPSKEEVIGVIGKGNEVTVVRKIYAGFGKNSFMAEVLVYESEGARNEIEVIPKKVKKKREEERKAHEAEEAKKKAEAEKLEQEKKEEVKE